MVFSNEVCRTLTAISSRTLLSVHVERRKNDEFQGLLKNAFVPDLS